MGPEAYHPDGGYAASETGETRSESYVADFRYNCHGYAFAKDGLSQYQLLINDGTGGAGQVLYAHYDEFTATGASIAGALMYMGSHTNFVQYDYGAACNYRAAQIRFKFRCSQLFVFDYAPMGRNPYDPWDDMSPTYYRKK